MGHCPVCKTMFNQVNHRPLCVHVIWKGSLHRGKWVVVKTPAGMGKNHVQGQKYNINPRWRRRKAGDVG